MLKLGSSVKHLSQNRIAVKPLIAESVPISIRICTDWADFLNLWYV